MQEKKYNKINCIALLDSVGINRFCNEFCYLKKQNYAALKILSSKIYMSTKTDQCLHNIKIKHPHLNQIRTRLNPTACSFSSGSPYFDHQKNKFKLRVLSMSFLKEWQQHHTVIFSPDVSGNRKFLLVRTHQPTQRERELQFF